MKSIAIAEEHQGLTDIDEVDRFNPERDQPLETLLSHPALGASWETWVIDNLIAAAGPEVQAHFYRTAAGAEVDLLLTHPDGTRWVVEIKRSLSPKLERGFHHACADLLPQRRWLVYPGQTAWRIADDVQVLPLQDLMAALVTFTATGN